MLAPCVIMRVRPLVFEGLRLCGDKHPMKNLDILTAFDHVIWLGDLNYRVDVDFTQAEECVKNNFPPPLLAQDQLKRQMELGEKWKGLYRSEQEAEELREEAKTLKIEDLRKYVKSWLRSESC